jgi:CDGSH-type Zn-finger protein
VHDKQTLEVGAASGPPSLVEIKVRDNGPYKVTGPVRLVDVEGREFEVPAGRSIALCRCGHSRTKPFCDRSHREAGFTSCERAGA